MKSARALLAALAAFATAAVALVFALARRVSRRTGKSIPASLPDVPGEAQRLVSDVRTRTAEGVNASLETIREKEAAIKERIVSHGHAQEAAPEVAEAESAEAGEAAAQAEVPTEGEAAVGAEAPGAAAAEDKPAEQAGAEG